MLIRVEIGIDAPGIDALLRRTFGRDADEKRIAQFILDDVAAAAELPIAEIARLTQTSQ
ncbi:hypothetical protein ACQKEG_22775, partial [Klebsiella quasipneumoniae]